MRISVSRDEGHAYMFMNPQRVCLKCLNTSLSMYAALLQIHPHFAVLDGSRVYEWHNDVSEFFTQLLSQLAFLAAISESTFQSTLAVPLSWYQQVKLH